MRALREPGQGNTPPAPVKPDPSGLRTLAQDLAALREAEGADDRKLGDPGGHTDDGADVSGWDHVRDAAARLFGHEPDPHYRILLWLNGRRALAGMHEIGPLWLDALRGFYASGKPVMVARKGLRAGGSVTACCALTIDALDTIRDVDPGTVLVFPIMSSSRDEATDRFFTIRRMLRAMGVAPAKGDDEEMLEVLPGGIGGEYKSTKSLSGGGVIQFEDSQGHKLEMRILPAIRRAAVGYTGGGFFLDETDLWPSDAELHVNPADIVIADVLKRITTQPTARGYIFSASYYASSAHSRRVDLGDTSAQYIVRLGAVGARIDEEARLWFAEKIGSTDPRLLAPGDPTSPDLPAWVFNHTAPIERCYQLSDDLLTPMLALYGGRAAENAAIDAKPRPLAALTFSPPFHLAPCLDTVTGIAPDAAGWVTVTVGIDAAGTLRVVSIGAGLSSLTGSALVVNVQHGARLVSEIAALVAGAPVYVPGVEARALYDGATLRTGALRTLYERGRVRHVPGLGALEAALHAYVEEEPAPHVEALAAATLRLVVCYPWWGAEQGETAKGPAPRRGLFEDGGGGGRVSMAGPHGTVRRG